MCVGDVERHVDGRLELWPARHLHCRSPVREQRRWAGALSNNSEWRTRVSVEVRVAGSNAVVRGLATVATGSLENRPDRIHGLSPTMSRFELDQAGAVRQGFVKSSDAAHLRNLSVKFDFVGDPCAKGRRMEVIGGQQRSVEVDTWLGSCEFSQVSKVEP